MMVEISISSFNCLSNKIVMSTPMWKNFPSFQYALSISSGRQDIQTAVSIGIFCPAARWIVFPTYSAQLLASIIADPVSCAALTSVSIACGSIQSSLSMKEINCPFAFSTLYLPTIDNNTAGCESNFFANLFLGQRPPGYLVRLCRTKTQLWVILWMR